MMRASTAVASSMAGIDFNIASVRCTSRPKTNPKASSPCSFLTSSRFSFMGSLSPPGHTALHQMKTLSMDKSPFLGCLVAALPWVKALTDTSDIKLNIRKNESCSYQTYSCDGNEFEL